MNKVQVMHILLISVIFIVSGLFPGSSSAAERNQPIRIGAREWNNVLDRAIIQALLTESVGVKVVP